MKVLVLTKRQYMAKDLLNDRFGRFRELPLELARLGHKVIGICLSYRPREEGTIADADLHSNSRVIWHSLNLGRLIVPGLIRYSLKVHKLAKEFKPDLIWVCSDSFHVIFGVRLAKRLNVKCVVDLYDNFAAFSATRLTGVLPLFKRAVRKADGVTCLSKRLAKRILQHYGASRVAVIESGVREDLFYPRDPRECRRRLGLPQDAKIIGTAGALYNNRAIDTLFRAYELLAAKDATLHLAIAGPREKRIAIPGGPRVHDLGLLPWDQVPLLMNSLDVAVSCYRDSDLGRYSFPQKVYEILACKTPIVAAAVGNMNELLSTYPECLFDPENAESLARSIRLQLAHPTIIGVQVPSWSDAARDLEKFLLEILGPSATMLASNS
jgi:teichuronic acid biosynthesis glycosyltransferase TuaC